ncbi:MAG: secretion system protein [Crocinitomicaceae bacterium]|nr:secretion system protein [Crocinitomicaceae bacterium]
MKFYYEGVDLATQQSVQGEWEAVSRQDVVRGLEQQRIEALQVRLVENKPNQGRKVKKSDLVLPLQELATLMEQGVTLIEAIKALSENNENQNLANGFALIVKDVESGQSFSEAIAKSKLPFPSFVSPLINGGEAAGQLAVALRNASNQLSYDQSVRDDLRGALTYPLVLIAAGLVAMLIIFISVVPKFTHLLESSGDLPLLASMVLSAGKLASDSPWILLGLAVVLLCCCLFLLFNATVRKTAMNIAIELPVIGPWLSEQDMARWASLSSAMLTARVDLLKALSLAAESCQYERRRERAMQMIRDIEEGESFSDALKRANLISATSLNLVLVGDKTGQLAKMLAAVAELHDTSCKRRMKQVLQLIEPVAIVVVGVFIGVMILGIVQAITSSTDLAF